MLVKLAAVALVLGIVPAALWVTGNLPPPHARGDLVPYLPEAEVSAEAEWRQRVAAICGWQRKQGKTLGKAFRRAAVPADVQLLLESVIRLEERSAAIFKRLEPPLVYRREARTLQRLLLREHLATKKILGAVEQQNRTAFFRAWRQLAAADSRSSRIFTQLGIDGCRAKPVDVPDEERASVV